MIEISPKIVGTELEINTQMEPTPENYTKHRSGFDGISLMDKDGFNGQDGRCISLCGCPCAVAIEEMK